MDELRQLINAYDKASEEFSIIMGEACSRKFSKIDRFSNGAGRIALGDNLEYMKHLLFNENMGGCIQLVYIDPPFFAREKFMSSIRLQSDRLGTSPVIKIGAYDDNSGGSLQEYLQELCLRMMMIRELLTDTGLIWLHLDRRVTHYAKVLMDMVFGSDCFINEVIWTYKSGGAGKKCFARKHDNLLVYSKSARYKFNVLKEKSYNRDFKPYRFKGVEEFEDELGWYTMVNMKDVWQIDMVGRTSSERQGYATQKPEKLMERIISSCSDAGDLCADFYGGSGAFAAACDRMGRNWISCDNNGSAVTTQISRMSSCDGGFIVLSADDWPQGTAVMNGDAIESYAAPLENITSSDKEIMSEYMREDGCSFIRCCHSGTDECGEYLAGYDVLGNMFKIYM